MRSAARTEEGGTEPIEDKVTMVIARETDAQEHEPAAPSYSPLRHPSFPSPPPGCPSLGRAIVNTL